MAKLIRDYTDSDKINLLSCEAERFFSRLMLKADDFGGFHGRTSLLKAHLFPLRLDSVSEADIARWMNECKKAKLIILYEVADKPFVRIIDFGQKLKRPKKVFPDPLDNFVQSGTEKNNVVQTFPEEEGEEEIENEGEREGVPAGSFVFNPDFLKKEFENSFSENEKLCRDLKISGPQLENFRADFLKEIDNTQEYYEYKNMRDARRHLYHWINKRLNGKNISNGTNTKGW